MNRQTIFQYVKKSYDTEPDYPWKSAPTIAILRHKKTRKWYAAVLNPSKRQLGLSDEDICMDILNLKCDPEMSSFLLQKDGILPGYHMNKEHWISVLLDGSISDDEILKLLDLSYDITKQKK